MEWRNSIPSPQSYRYFIIVFDSVEELEDFELPGWFDTNKMGYIAIYDGVIYGIDGPDTTDWLPEIGYPAAEIPTFVSHLKVLYPYEGTYTHLAFVRFPALDSEKSGEKMYAWTIGTSNWDTVYTETLACTTSTQLWYLDDQDWRQSNAEIEEGVWTDLVSVVVENEATNVVTSGIEVETSEGVYHNSYRTFVGCLADFREPAIFTIGVASTGWVWQDLETSLSPREESVSKLGLYLKVVDA